MTTINLVEIGVSIAAALITLWIAYSALRRRSLINSGYGVAALNAIDFGARNVDAKIVRVPDVSRSWAASHVAETAYTVVTVDHDAHIDDVVEYRGGAADAIDAESLPGLISRPTHDASSAISLEQLGFVRGVVQIGPNFVRFVEPGELLAPDYLRAVVDQLLAIGDRAEQHYPA